MNIKNDCDTIRERIEDGILGRDVKESKHIYEHLQMCGECRAYQAKLEALHVTSKLHYSLPAYERMNLSAKIRTRIEEKKSARRRRGIITRPAFRIAAMIVIILSVALYMIQTDPDTVIVFDEESIELLDQYSLFFDDFPVPDDAIIADMYNEILFDGDIYVHDEWYPGLYDFDYYYELDDLSPDEIDYIIQRLEEV